MVPASETELAYLSFASFDCRGRSRGLDGATTRLPRNDRALGPLYDALNMPQRVVYMSTKVECTLTRISFGEMGGKDEMRSVSISISFSTDNRESLQEKRLNYVD